MAVKYSKERDFGAKGRKTRKLGNKMFKLVSMTKFKALAKSRAEIIRGRGKLARVVKMTKGGKTMYGVYSHGRRGSIGYRKRLARLSR
tara:strand:+ start:3838 stop:4101 length:264 start_codon:yes stop_codon:yes gene_type:complete